MKDYGLSWDYHYHYYAGRYHLGLSVPKIEDVSPVPFSPPDPRLTTEDPFGPYTQIVPTLFSYVFHEKMDILPFDQAYNLPTVIIGALGIYLIFVITTDLWNKKAGWLSCIFLAFLPTYFGYLHTDMKDIPNAFFFSLSLYLFFKLTQKPTIQRLISSSISFSLAFNTKINSIFIPGICASYFILSNLSYLRNLGNLIKNNKKILTYFMLSSLFAFLLWIPFWSDPIGKLMELPKFYSNNTYAMPILFFGKMYKSGINIPFGYPFVYIAITTPIIMLAGFILGLILLILKTYKNKSRNISIFILLWFFIPLVRYFSPKAGAIDGMRHFMEIVYPLACIAGIGWSVLLSRFHKNIQVVTTLVIALLLMVPTIYTHPYQTSYFNAFIGGIRGTNHLFDIDFWGTPQKEAVTWLNQNALPGSTIYIVMAQSSAAVYLRTDLLKSANTLPYDESDYVVLLNRESFFSLYGISSFKDRKILENKVVYTKKLDGIPLVWIFKK